MKNNSIQQRVEYRLGDVIQVLEALEMLDMRYTIYKVYNYMNTKMQTKHAVAWVIEYEQGPEVDAIPEEMFEE